MAGHTLLTGATGLLGRYLLRELLAQGTPVAVVVRPSEKRSAVDRIEDVLHLWESHAGVSLPRPACLVGDVRSDSVGLDAEARSWISEHCDRMIHSAAVLNLHGSVRDGEPWTTNVEGTRNVLDLCREAGIGEVHYVSTAYVSGCRQGRILESELDEGQDFRNDYEASKLEAEQLVRACPDIESLTVYRPAVISGDSVTGYTSTYHGLYLYLRLMATLVPMQPVDEHGRHRTPIRLPMSGDEPRNVVPVDWVAEVMTYLLNTREAHGRTYHLSPERPLTPREMIDACCGYFNSTGVEYVGPDFEHDRSEMSDFERLLLENITVYEPYSATDPVFDTSNLKRFASHLSCPIIDEAMLRRYLKYAEEDRWGRRPSS